MLGGYYLGQLYLGLSGQVSAGSITIQNTDHGHSAGNITLVQHTLDIDSNVHTLFDDLTRVINLADYSYYSGIYIKDFGSKGDIDQAIPEYGVVVVDRTTNVDTLVPATSDSGTFMTEFSAFGRYK